VYTCTCIVPDLHDDDGTHAPVLYHIYMMVMIHMYFIVPDLHDHGTHAPVLYQIYMMMMMMHMYFIVPYLHDDDEIFYCTRST
jgi:hypothetical protein